MMTRRVITLLAAAAAMQFSLAPGALAQETIPGQIPVVAADTGVAVADAGVASAATGMPSRDAAQLGVRPGSVRVLPSETGTPAPAIRGTADNNTLLMIVGGVLFLAGIAMDDDAGTVVALSGLGVGLYGLIRSMQ